MNKTVTTVKSIIPLKMLKRKLLSGDQKQKALKKQIRLLSKIDSISDFPTFRRAVRPLLNSNTILNEGRFGEDAYYYGHYASMLKYAGIKRTVIPVFSDLEHGVRFGSEKWRHHDESLIFACQGPERVSEIADFFPSTPVFILGPYIRYARPYYSAKQFEAKKKELGKTLLVFPSHTFELDKDGSISSDMFNTVYEKYAHSYDTVMVCIYWNDIDDPLWEKYARKGAVLVSAGFRGDSHFIERLKTIIMLSDTVIGDDLGTNIGYCLAMKKKFILAKTIFRKNEKIEKYSKQFVEAFSSENGRFSAEQLSLQKELYKRFWGGSDFTLNRREMKELMEGIIKIYRKSLYSLICIRNNLAKALAQKDCPVYKYHLFNRYEKMQNEFTKGKR